MKEYVLLGLFLTASELVTNVYAMENQKIVNQQTTDIWEDLKNPTTPYKEFENLLTNAVLEQKIDFTKPFSDEQWQILGKAFSHYFNAILKERKEDYLFHPARWKNIKQSYPDQYEILQAICVTIGLYYDAVRNEDSSDLNSDNPDFSIPLFTRGNSSNVPIKQYNGQYKEIINNIVRAIIPNIFYDQPMQDLHWEEHISEMSELAPLDFSTDEAWKNALKSDYQTHYHNPFGIPSQAIKSFPPLTKDEENLYWNKTGGTLNKMGELTNADWMGESAWFQDFQKNSGPFVLSIGCGLAPEGTEILQKSHMVFNDLSPEHLKIVALRYKNASNGFYLNNQRFPFEMDFPPESFSSIFVSHLGHYLSPEELEEGFRRMATWLKPGGRIYYETFRVNSFPFEFAKQRHKIRKNEGEKWPGYIPNVKEIKPEGKEGFPDINLHPHSLFELRRLANENNLKFFVFEDGKSIKGSFSHMRKGEVRVVFQKPR